MAFPVTVTVSVVVPPGEICVLLSALVMVGVKDPPPPLVT